MRYAVINTATGVVENLIELDQGNDWPVPEDHEVIQSDIAGPGWTYSAGEFSAPAEKEA